MLTKDATKPKTILPRAVQFLFSVETTELFKHCHKVTYVLISWHKKAFNDCKYLNYPSKKHMYLHTII